jgi:hypothetical protein
VRYLDFDESFSSVTFTQKKEGSFEPSFELVVADYMF